MDEEETCGGWVEEWMVKTTRNVPLLQIECGDKYTVADPPTALALSLHSNERGRVESFGPPQRLSPQQLL